MKIISILKELSEDTAVGRRRRLCARARNISEALLKTRRRDEMTTIRALKSPRMKRNHQPEIVGSRAHSELSDHSATFSRVCNKDV